MSDQENFLTMLKNWGLQPEVKLAANHARVFLKADETPFVEGYGGFYAEFLFDGDGAFMQVSIWE